MKTYRQKLNRIDDTFGAINIFFLMVMVTYLITSIVRKHRMSGY